MKSVVLFIAILLFSENPHFQKENAVFFKDHTLLTDHLFNFYSISDQSIKKYDVKGKELGNYSNSYLGSINYTDVSDPFRILLFYKDFNQIVFLDKYLTQILSPINLDDLDIGLPSIACVSGMGGFWVFDEQNSQLKHFNRNLKIINESTSVNTLINTKQKPSCLLEKNNYLFIDFPDAGIVILDKYGAFYKTYKVKNIDSFQVDGKNIYYFRDNAFIRYNFELLQTDTLPKPQKKDIKNIRLEKNKVFVQTIDSLYLYSYISQ